MASQPAIKKPIEDPITGLYQRKQKEKSTPHNNTTNYPIQHIDYLTMLVLYMLLIVVN